VVGSLTADWIQRHTPRVLGTGQLTERTNGIPVRGSVTHSAGPLIRNGPGEWHSTSPHDFGRPWFGQPRSGTLLIS